MGAVHESMTEALQAWILRQHMFFVATAPLSQDQFVNVSPKALPNTFAILNETTVAYLDLTGSGIETVAHLRENGRVTLMWCAFDGPPRIVRIHGRGEVVLAADPRWPELIGRFGEFRAARAIIVVSAERISDSCGYSVPLYTYESDRTRLVDWAQAKSDQEIVDYRVAKNTVNIDGLPGL
jgi:Pyridoxamine 5'-phosphate oxidase